MNKKFLTLAATALVIGGFSSCNKVETNGTTETGGEGTLEISLNFASSASTKTVSGETVPTSHWSDIASLRLLIMSGASVIADKDLSSYLTSAGNGNQVSMSVSSIPVGTGYTAYLVANGSSTETTSASTYGYGGMPESDFSSTNTTLSVPSGNANELSNILSDINDYDVYGVAPNYFVASSSASFNITNGGSTTVSMSLKRIVNLIRVRIDRDPSNSAYSENANISFSHADAYMILRRVQSKYSVTDNSYAFNGSTSTPAKTVAYYKGNFENSDPNNGYVSGSSVVVGTTGYEFYKDMLAFPTLANSGNSSPYASADEDYYKLNLVLIGVTTNNNYLPDGSASTVSEGTKIAWETTIDLTEIQGQSNQVAVINAALMGRGKDVENDPIGPPGTYGTIAVEVSIENWADYNEYSVSL